jgi:hypothetical protein
MLALTDRDVPHFFRGNKSRKGFLVMMLGNLLWCIIGIWAKSYAMVAANLGFFSMNVRGFIKWTTPTQAAKEIHAFAATLENQELSASGPKARRSILVAKQRLLPHSGH